VPQTLLTSSKTKIIEPDFLPPVNSIDTDVILDKMPGSPYLLEKM
jgi:hypothetical protein